MFEPAIRGMVHVVSYAHGPYGTVSAHAATVAALAVISSLTIRRPWFTWLMVAVTLLVCYSRIYLACHYPMDLLLGLVVGIVSGGAMYLLYKKLAEVLKKFS